MDTSVIVSVNDQGQLNLPPEIQRQLQPGDQYKIILKANSIVFEKISKSTVDLDEFLQNLDQLEPDPEQPTLQEISDIVKEVRQDLWSKE